MMEILVSLAVYLAALIVLVGLTAWVIVRMKQDSSNRSSGSLGSAMLEIQSMFEPSSTHAVRGIGKDEAADEEDAGVGEDPVAGRPMNVVKDSRSNP